MATVKTLAKINVKDGIPVHKHDNYGWHWASAGHRDEGKIHTDAGADKPEFAEGMNATDKENYGKALRREEGFVAKIPSKAKPKDKADAKDEKEPAKADSNSRTPATAGAR